MRMMGMVSLARQCVGHSGINEVQVSMATAMGGCRRASRFTCLSMTLPDV